MGISEVLWHRLILHLASECYKILEHGEVEIGILYRGASKLGLLHHGNDSRLKLKVMNFHIWLGGARCDALNPQGDEIPKHSSSTLHFRKGHMSLLLLLVQALLLLS